MKTLRRAGILLLAMAVLMTAMGLLSATGAKNGDTNVALGKPYLTSLLYRQGSSSVNWAWDENAAITYPDENGVTLTDGVCADVTDSFKSDVWMGFSSGCPDYKPAGYAWATVNLMGEYELSELVLRVGSKALGNGIAVPDAVTFLVSQDGESFTPVGTVTPKESTSSVEVAVRLTCNVTASYVQVRIQANGWMFVSELEAFGSKLEEQELPPSDPHGIAVSDTVTVDGLLRESAWEGVSFTRVDETVGTSQGGTMQGFWFEYAIRSDASCLYVALRSNQSKRDIDPDAGTFDRYRMTGTSLRLWLSVGKESTYDKLIDILCMDGGVSCFMGKEKTSAIRAAVSSNDTGSTFEICIPRALAADALLPACTVGDSFGLALTYGDNCFGTDGKGYDALHSYIYTANATAPWSSHALYPTFVTDELALKAYFVPDFEADVPVSHNNRYSWGVNEAMLVTRAGKSVMGVYDASDAYAGWLVYRVQWLRDSYVITAQSDGVNNDSLLCPIGGFLLCLHPHDTGYAALAGVDLVGATVTVPAGALDADYSLDVQSKSPYLFHIARHCENITDAAYTEWVASRPGEPVSDSRFLLDTNATCKDDEVVLRVTVKQPKNSLYGLEAELFFDPNRLECLTEVDDTGALECLESAPEGWNADDNLTALSKRKKGCIQIALATFGEQPITSAQGLTLCFRFRLQEGYTAAGFWIPHASVRAYDGDFGTEYAGSGSYFVLKSGHSHEVMYIPGVEATCTEPGIKAHYHCDGCGADFAEQACLNQLDGLVVPALGHDLVHHDGKEPTYTETGWEPYDTCTRCDYTTYRELPLKKKQLKILLIGNSYSADASDQITGRMNHSQTYDLFRSMLQEDVELQIGLVYSGGKTLAWHATKAYHDLEWGYPLYVTDAKGTWKKVSSVTTHKQALAYTDWDIVTLQSYANEAFTGIASDSREGYGFDEQFTELKNTIPYMLDLVATYAPTAKAYYYMHLAGANTSTKPETIHAKLVNTAKQVMTYRGTESGRVIEDTIAVGTALQNVRTTYLSTLTHNTDASPTPENDVVINLQRDKHLSFILGRYLAGMTFLKVLAPQELLAEGASPCNMRECPDKEIGLLPREYVEIIEKAADAAAKQPFAVTEIPGYTTDPARVAAEAIQKETYHFADAKAVSDGLLQQLVAAVGREDVRVSIGELTFADSTCVAEGSFRASVRVQFGYTVLTVELNGSMPTVGHTPGEWVVVKQPSSSENGRREQKCTICGILLAVEEIPASDYLYTVENGEITVTKYIGSGTDVTVPSTIDGYPVVAIGANAFSGKNGLVSVSIPDSVRSVGDFAFTLCPDLQKLTVGTGTQKIGSGAFRDCPALESITVASGNKTFHSAGNCLIETASKTLAVGCNSSVIPVDGSVTSIGEYAFYHRTGLTSVSIPGTVKTIGYEAFRYCTGLTALSLGDGVELIGDDAFSACTGLTALVLPDSVKEIDVDAFWGCTGLQSVDFGNGLTAIGGDAFHGCTGLTSVTIPDTVVRIGSSAFIACDALTEVFIPASVQTVGSYVFGSCTSLQDIYCGAASKPSGWDKDWSGCNATVHWGYAPHKHTPVFVTEVPATCTETGVKAHYYCEGCGKNFADEDCTTCIGEMSTLTVPALGHDLVKHDAKAPTCTEKGWKAYETCTRCDYTTYTELSPLGHDLVKHDAKAPTCTEKGWKAYETCTRCDYTTYTELSSLGHDLVKHDAKAPTCTEKGWKAYETCTRCDYTTYTELSPLGHDLVKHDAKAPTCTEKGWKAYETCTRCDYTTYTELSPLGHDLVKHDAKAPTCTEKGHNAYDECKRCDYTTYQELPANGHTPGEWEILTQPTETEHGVKQQTCTVCGIVIATTNIPALGHTHQMQFVPGKEQTCTEAGVKAHYHCDGCGKDYADEAGETELVDVAIPASGHTLNEWKTTKQPTCTEAGERMRSCAVCGTVVSVESVAATGHIPGTEATCTTAQTCITCGETLVEAPGHTPGAEATCTTAQTCITCGETLVEAPGHTPGDWEVTKEPTETEDGEQVKKCLTCGETLEREPIPAVTPAYLRGDINGDGKVDSADLVRLVKYASGEDVEVVAEALDTNGDGVFNMKDYIRLLRYLSGETVELH